MKKSSLVGHTAEVYSEILQSTRPADQLIDQFFRTRKYLGSHDRRFIAETVYGILRHKKRIEWILADLEIPQLQFKNKEEETSAVSCLTFLFLEKNESVENICKEVTEIFSGDPKEFLETLERKTKTIPAFDNELTTIATTYSFSEWMIGKLIGQFGKVETISLCETLNTPAPITLRVNTLKATIEECQSTLEKDGVKTTRTQFSPFGLNLEKRLNVFQMESFRNGFFEVQDEGSQLLALLVNPKPRSKVIDACAGAGGKSLAMAALMKNRGEIFAFDVHSGRLDELRKRIKRAGADTIRVRIVEENIFVEEHKQAMDYALVDAPCSGTGTIRRNPGMKWSVTQQMVDELSEKQFGILSHNAEYVRVGGSLVYATCSLIEQENEKVVERFLSLHPEFELELPSNILLRYNLAALAENKYFQLLPHKHGTDGFFAAVMKRLS